MENELFQNLTPVSSLLTADVDDPEDLMELAEEARDFLNDQSWCVRIEREYFYNGVGGVFALFLFEFQPLKPEIPASVWVIVGDVPPAYIDKETCPSPRDAVEGYIAEMDAWVEAVRAGEPVDDLIPVLRRGSLVPTPPTIENADLLSSRLGFIKEKLLPYFGEETDGSVDTS